MHDCSAVVSIELISAFFAHSYGMEVAKIIVQKNETNSIIDGV